MVDQLFQLETFVSGAFIQNQHLVVVFFDLVEPYDTTWKYGVLQQLHDMRLQGNLPSSFTVFKWSNFTHSLWNSSVW